MEPVKTRTNPFSISNILSNNTSQRECDVLREQEKKSDSDTEDGDFTTNLQKLEDMDEQTNPNTALLTRTGFCSWTESNVQDRKNSSSTRKSLLPFPTDSLQICSLSMSYLFSLIHGFIIFAQKWAPCFLWKNENNSSLNSLTTWLRSFRYWFAFAMYSCF